MSSEHSYEATENAAWLISLLIKYKALKLDIETYNEVACVEIKTLVYGYYGCWEAIQQLSMDNLFLLRKEMINYMIVVAKFCLTEVPKYKSDPIYIALEKQRKNTRHFRLVR